ncbi:MAG: bifunctional DNA-formamidopyrimidine glycosylase/DNA-(apurinic or apyrimidinic site) lyase [Candidatus Komeilibacteria bacterium]|nr:bifunctional DNA-formamidopyrimidine glycosylase/DNA-(apurinic or apyrimidinic site) lyase [Candidatus Komeilibacteria bacterium]
MPELPEVQTVVNHLANKIIGKVFLVAQVKAPKMVSHNFAAQIKNARVSGVSRRGKMIIITLADGRYLLSHLKMTGQMIYLDKLGKASGGGHPITFTGFDVTKPNQFTRIILDFKNGGQLLFHDIRKFGWLKIVNTQQFQQIVSKYGVEPLTQEFSLNKFKEILAKRPKLKIKQFLMEQGLIAGIGNIYADESLFDSSIHPLRPAFKLKDEEIKGLRQSIIKKLRQAIKLGGTSVNTFVSASGERGGFVAKLKVYQRGGQPCLRCHSILSKIKLGGRGTVFCSNCQK